MWMFTIPLNPRVISLTMLMLGTLLNMQVVFAHSEWVSYEDFNAQIIGKITSALDACNKAIEGIEGSSNAADIADTLTTLTAQLPNRPKATLDTSIGTMSSDEALLNNLNQFFSRVMRLADTIKTK